MKRALDAPVKPPIAKHARAMRASTKRGATLALATIATLSSACATGVSGADSSAPLTIALPPAETASSAPMSTSSAPKRAASPAPSASVKLLGGATISDEDRKSAPWVHLTADHRIVVDGVDIVGTAPYEAPPMKRVDPLFDVLKEKRELRRSLDPTRPFPGVLILQVDASVAAIVVKSVFQTAAFAGFPNVGFVVDDGGAPPP